MKEDKKVFLEVDHIEPAYKEGFSPFEYTHSMTGINVWIGDNGHFFPCNGYSVCDPDVAREYGRRQAFGLFKELYDMSPCDRADAFGKITMLDLVSKNTYEDIVKKLDSWKKEKETIRVRDEVCHQPMQANFVVTKIFVPFGDEDAIVNGIKKDGTTVKGVLLHNVKKTGLHVDDLDSYLEV